METFVPLVKKTISQKNTFKRTRLKFVGIIWAKIWPTRASKGFEERVIRSGVEQFFERRFILENLSGKTIDEITCRLEGIIPISKRHAGMREKSQTCFHNVTMLTFNGAILLMRMRTRDAMNYATICKERGNCTIFTTPIRLNRFNFGIKESFNIFLKF